MRCTLKRVCVCVRVYMYIYMYMYMYMYICIYVCMYVCVCVYIYIGIYKSERWALNPVSVSTHPHAENAIEISVLRWSTQVWGCLLGKHRLLETM